MNQKSVIISLITIILVSTVQLIAFFLVDITKEENRSITKPINETQTITKSTNENKNNLVINSDKEVLPLVVENQKSDPEQKPTIAKANPDSQSLTNETVQLNYHELTYAEANKFYSKGTELLRTAIKHKDKKDEENFRLKAREAISYFESTINILETLSDEDLENKETKKLISDAYGLKFFISKNLLYSN